jgi:uncharacterized protein YdeI (YjbR/CyaY-like superfamily)
MVNKLDRSRLLYVKNRNEWRTWLKKNYKSEREVWLIYYKVHTGKVRITYNDAVEEALCFGWIDSTVRTIDNDKYAQKFSMRHTNRPYSQANKERLRELIKEGKVKKEIMSTLGNMEVEKFKIPADILKEIKDNPMAWKNIRTYSPGYIRIRIAFIDGSRKRPEEFKRRLKYFIEMSEKNKQFGFGGINKYYK